MNISCQYGNNLVTVVEVDSRYMSRRFRVVKTNFVPLWPFSGKTSPAFCYFCSVPSFQFMRFKFWPVAVGDTSSQIEKVLCDLDDYVKRNNEY